MTTADVSNGHGGLKPETWAVGSGVIYRWTGGAWKKVAGATEQSFTDYHLNSIVAIPNTHPQKFFAVGGDHSKAGSSNDSISLIEEWTGAKWVRMVGGKVSTDASLQGVDAVSFGDAWAVGYDDLGSIIEHWNGNSWHTVVNGTPKFANALEAVTIVNSHNVWAVGHSCPYGCRYPGPTGNTPLRSPSSSKREWAAASSMGRKRVARKAFSSEFMTVIDHWNGTKWSPVNSAPANIGLLESITAVSATNIWAVGYLHDTQNKHNGTLAMHWNGTAWHNVTTVNPVSSTDMQALLGVARAGGNKLWAVGFVDSPDGVRSLVEKWNGTHWTLAASQNSMTAVDILRSVSVDPKSGRVWAVGGVTQRWNGSQWQLVQGPSIGTNNVLNGIASVGGSAGMWAVGHLDFSVSPAGTPEFQDVLIEKYNGSSWKIVGGPSFLNGNLSAVVAPSSSEAFAVGSFTGSDGSDRGLVLQWNGTSWKKIPNAYQKPGESESLTSLSEISPTDIWAAGQLTDSGSGDEPLAEHWDGASWSIVPFPALVNQYNGGFSGIKAFASDNVWAVGWIQYHSSSADFPNTLVEHWDGVKWTQVSTKSGGYSASLTAIDGANAGDFWAVGSFSDFDHIHTLFVHRSGSAWTYPNPPNSGGVINAVSAPSSSNVWAAGQLNPTTGSTNLVDHWNGTKWTSMSAPGPANGTLPQFNGVTFQPSTQVAWAVGKYTSISGVQRTLTEHSP